jgi:DNA-binding transcriptional ArsR family regulator
MGTGGPSVPVTKRAGRVELGPYFTVPKVLIQSGIAGRIGPYATVVYIALCEHANRGKREDQNTFSVSDRALAADTGIAERTIRNHRTKLVEQGLISCRRDTGQSYIYTILLLPSEWVPIKDRPRKKRKRRALHASRLALVEVRQPQAALANLTGPSGKVC